MRQIYSILVNNHAGVLSHISGLFARRGYNIESIAAGPTENPEVTRITIVAVGEHHELEQIAKQLRKLYDVREVNELEYNRSVTRELVLVSLRVEAEERGDVFHLAHAMGAQIVNVSDDTITLELSGNDHKTRTFIKALDKFGVVQIARTGMIALPFDGVPDNWEPLL